MEQAFQAARETLEEAVRQDPINPTALKLRGDVLYLLGQEQEAEALIVAAIKYDPDNPEPYYALGRIYYQQNRFAESIVQFSKVLERDPKSFRAYDNMGLAYEGLNDNTRAMEYYQRALALVHKDHRDYDWVYGNVPPLYKEGNYFSAFQFAAEAANRNPNSGRNFYLGEGKRSQGLESQILRRNGCRRLWHWTLLCLRPTTNTLRCCVKSGGQKTQTAN